MIVHLVSSLTLLALGTRSVFVGRFFSEPQAQMRGDDAMIRAWPPARSAKAGAMSHRKIGGRAGAAASQWVRSRTLAGAVGRQAAFTSAGTMDNGMVRNSGL
jgi:hypothetical protein